MTALLCVRCFGVLSLLPRTDWEASSYQCVLGKAVVTTSLIFFSPTLPRRTSEIAWCVA